MINTIEMYSVVCDRCGRTLDDGVVWEYKSTAISYALNSKWKEIGDKHYCQDCYEFDKELDKYVPKMIYRNDVLGNHLVKGAKVLCRNSEFDILSNSIGSIGVVMITFLFELRIICPSFKEVCKCTVEVQLYISQSKRIYFGKPSAT